MTKKKMTNAELVRAVLGISVETGSLVCLGCGHEHDCGIHGCAILREAATLITSQQAEIAKKDGDILSLAIMRTEHENTIDYLQLELVRLTALNTEAMELLEAAVVEIQHWCENCLYRLTDGQYCQDKSVSQCSDWKWEHSDRYEALKAQEG